MSREKNGPDFSHESEWAGPVAGVDEVGRGPLAGPVLAAAAILDPHRLPDELVGGLRDSKKLTAAKRESLAAGLLAAQGAGVWAVIAAASVAEIEAYNILGATHLAMRRALDRLPLRPVAVLIDGNRPPKGLTLPHRCLVGGDDRSLSIAAASILAKVTRDRLMARLATRYPAYGWEKNAGYPVPAHRAALLAVGPTRHHRRSFGGVRDLFNTL
ncbi:ribonuclease HII [Elstera cyanobacteriorum]|uniref:ribonuclease HII n=1 Tax=Elstera cyanobacteriorum TaxID=2022747 RepID=UPI0019928587|nr:ribonuclease HII [Elstera cyanobacteriorum]GFZ95163.1 ribonuclease HII [Elstera cyanobacteriorum]